MSRHASCFDTKNKPATNNQVRRIPVLIKPVPSDGIIVQVRKVSAEITEMKKNIAVESAARNRLTRCVEELKAENEEAKKYFVQRAKDPADVTQQFMKTLPCKSLSELDWLLAYIEDKDSQWTAYLKLLGGSDFNSSIKIILNTLMVRSVQKQLSWTGIQSKKPSFKQQYKGIVDGIHVAMRDNFKDYTIAQGEAKIVSILKNAARCKI